ncbi:MAG: hypothetical protein Q8R92_12995 [Deltaproteobacteria bacterium]|nr:hypothetical protein [Deltaproteobacteria bacterium]
MNCQTQSYRTRNQRGPTRLGQIGHGSRPRRIGAVERFKETLYGLVDTTARERFEARKPRF